MSQQVDAQQAIKSTSVAMFAHYDTLYKDKWAHAIQMLTDKAGLSLREDTEYKAGIVWILIYDLVGAIATNSIKNQQVVTWFVEEIADKYGVDAKSLEHVMNGDSHESAAPPYTIFQDICSLIDESYRPKVIEDKEAIQGFYMFAKNIMDSSNLGYLFDHIGDITGSAKA